MKGPYKATGDSVWITGKLNRRIRTANDGLEQNDPAAAIAKLMNRGERYPVLLLALETLITQVYAEFRVDRLSGEHAVGAALHNARAAISDSEEI